MQNRICANVQFHVYSYTHAHIHCVCVCVSSSSYLYTVVWFKSIFSVKTTEA